MSVKSRMKAIVRLALRARLRQSKSVLGDITMTLMKARPMMTMVWKAHHTAAATILQAHWRGCVVRGAVKRRVTKIQAAWRARSARRRCLIAIVRKHLQAPVRRAEEIALKAKVAVAKSISESSSEGSSSSSSSSCPADQSRASGLFSYFIPQQWQGSAHVPDIESTPKELEVQSALSGGVFQFFSAPFYGAYDPTNGKGELALSESSDADVSTVVPEDEVVADLSASKMT